MRFLLSLLVLASFSSAFAVEQEIEPEVREAIDKAMLSELCSWNKHLEESAKEQLDLLHTKRALLVAAYNDVAKEKKDGRPQSEDMLEAELLKDVFENMSRGEKVRLAMLVGMYEGFAHAKYNYHQFLLMGLWGSNHGFGYGYGAGYVGGYSGLYGHHHGPRPTGLSRAADLVIQAEDSSVCVLSRGNVHQVMNYQDDEELTEYVLESVSQAMYAMEQTAELIESEKKPENAESIKTNRASLKALKIQGYLFQRDLIPASFNYDEPLVP